MSQSSVQAILQDNLGFLWIGTQDGLNRFDGYSFKVFRPDPGDPQSLSDSYVSSIIQGDGHVIWVGTHSGLDRYDQVTGKFNTFLHDDKDPDSLASDIVQALYLDSQGLLWVGTAQGLDALNPATGKFKHITIPNKQSLNGYISSVNVLFQDSRGILWVGTNDGLISMNLETQDIKLYQNESGDNGSLSYNAVSSISEDKSGVLWIGTYAGLNQLQPSTGRFEHFTHSDFDPASLANNLVMATYVDRGGQLWVGTRNGLDRFQPQYKNFVHYQSDSADPSSLSDNAIDSIYEDRGGLLWIGTNNEGLNEYDRSQDKFAYYHHINGNPHSLSGDVILSILPLSSGKVWIGTYQAGLDLFDPATGQSEIYRHEPGNPDSLLSNTITALYLDRTGALWIGTSQGMDRLDHGSSKFIHYDPNTRDPNSIPFGTIYQIYQDLQSNYWIATQQGLRRFDPTSGEFTKINSETSNSTARLNSDPVTVIYEDQSRSLWLGTRGQGIIRFNPVTQDVTNYKNGPNLEPGLSNNTILDIYGDSRGTVWVATEGGLDRYLPEGNTFTQYLQNGGLPNDVVHGILEDTSGHLWLSTNFGISQFDPAKGTFQNYTVTDGLQSNEFNSGSFAKDAVGRMYFGGVKGLTVFDPANILTDQYIPPVALTSLTTQNGDPLTPARSPETMQGVELSYPQNSFDFSFTALSFSQMNKNQYKYKLEGFDKDWHIAGSVHQSSYTNLPGGTYTLHLQGSNSDGVWNEAGTSIEIRVIPPFWQTWLFRGLSGLLLILAVVLGYQWRERGVQAQKIELAHIIRERTSALQKRNLDLEALYSADEKMLRVLTLDQVLQALVDVAVEILQADKSAVFTQTEPHGEFTVRVSRGFNPETIPSLHLAESENIAALTSDAQAPVIVNDIMNEPDGGLKREVIIEKMAAENVNSLMFIPIKLQDTILGLFNVCSSKPGEFDEDRQRLFASLVQRTALSIENIHLFDQIMDLAIIEERNRLAQDLHDNAKQKSFAALAQLGAAKKLMEQNVTDAEKYVVEAENIVSEVIHDLTFLIQELYPRNLKERGLAGSLRDYAFEWERRSSIQLNLSVTGERTLHLEMEQAIYRIVHEGLSNIARHSQGTKADVRIEYHDQELEIQVSDNGKGFDLQRTYNGLGLRLIRERTESIGGQVDFQSQPGEGTRLSIRIPLPARDKEQS